MVKILPFLNLFLLIHCSLFAQRAPLTTPPLCSSPELTTEQRQTLSRQAEFALRTKLASNAGPAAITYVPIRPHIFRRTNGTGGMTLNTMNNIMAIANSYYLQNGTGIQFYFCGTTPDYVDNDSLFNGYSASNEPSLNGRDATNALNQYYVNAFNPSGIAGYAYFPSNSVLSTRSFILNESDESDLGNRLLPHELGHNFSLFHTFGNNGSTAELVTRGAGANCTTEGDLLCDTPADPYGMPNATRVYIDNCETYNGTATDAQGNPYTPSMTNLMSYYFACTHEFTPGQYNRIQAGLALRQSHTAYSIDCPPTAVAAPTNVVATLAGGNVVLNWKDNAANEMGYFIERSTSSSSGFVPIGGVGANTQTFTDYKTAFQTTYYYRIRPSNATTAGVSETASIRTSSCHPTYGPAACSENDGLSSLVLSTTIISQNSGCSPNGYSLATATSATVTAGQSYSVSGNFLNSSYAQGVTVWADLNRNGLYEAERSELLYQSPTTLIGKFAGSLTLPGSLTAGPLPLRVIVAYNKIPLDPCGTYSYGETEDYQLMVTNPASIPPAVADLNVSMRVSNRTPDINEPVSYSLTLRNSGPLDAGAISWQNRLPANMSFVSGGAGVSSSGTAVTGTGLSLANGASVTYVYQLRATQAGMYRNAVQIMTSDQPDPDSQPDSGTGDGQDDAAEVDIRTVPGSNLIYASPNPNQKPLPGVASNQPAPDPTKADLSLAMWVNTRTPKPGGPVTFTVTVSNAGGLPADNVVVRDTLRGLSLLSSPTNVTVVSSGTGYSLVEGAISSIAVGGSAQLIFTAMATATGSLANTAQIWSAGKADPDSTPASINPINGEDDSARIDLRVSP